MLDRIAPNVTRRSALRLTPAVLTLVAGCFAAPVTFVVTAVTKSPDGSLKAGKGASVTGRVGHASLTIPADGGDLTVEATETAPDKSTFRVTFPGGTQREVSIDTGRTAEVFLEGQSTGVRIWNGGG